MPHIDELVLHIDTLVPHLQYLVPHMVQPEASLCSSLIGNPLHNITCITYNFL